MAQGSINQLGPIGNPMQGIAAALDAVQKFYGINTEKTKQKILEMQMPAEAAKAEASTKEAKYNSNLWDMLNSNSGPQNTAPAQKDPNAVVPMAGAENMPAGAPQSPLARAMALQKQGYILPAPVMASVVGATDLANKQTEFALKSGELKNQPEKFKLEEEKGPTEISDKFDTATKQSRENMAAYDEVLKDINSKNPSRQQSAVSKFALTKFGIKRLGDAVQEGVENKDEILHWQNNLNQLATGKNVQKVVSELSDAASQSKTSEIRAVNDVANTAAARMGRFGVSHDNAMDQHLLPNWKYGPTVMGLADKSGVSADAAYDTLLRLQKPKQRGNK